jgi:uncharacterized membrane protein
MGTTTAPVPSAAATPLPLEKGRPPRLDSVDLLRGLVMVIMALDHVRDYFSDKLFLDPVDLKTTSPGIFLTRWITHYCAPTFVFLAGTGAFLSGTRGKSKGALSWFLLTRGLWLVFLEVTVIKLSWAFHWSPYEHGGGVFWAIGWSMVVLSALVFLPRTAIAVFGILMVCCHNAYDGLTADQVNLPSWLWMILHSPDNLPIPPAGHAVTIALHAVPGLPATLPLAKDVTFGTGYCLIPWMAVMALGYCFGQILQLEASVRRRELFTLGASLTVAFILLRASNVYGDANRWEEQPTALYTFFSFLNCTKYPPSLMYLLMTLGPAILVLAALDRAQGPLARFFIVFGRVPLFYYLLHIPLIHGLAVLIDFLRFGWSPLATNGPWVLGFNPDMAPASGMGLEVVRWLWAGIVSYYGFGLPIVYLVWISVVVTLYFPCRWFAGVKQRRKEAWLSYL